MACRDYVKAGGACECLGRAYDCLCMLVPACRDLQYLLTISTKLQAERVAKENDFPED